MRCAGVNNVDAKAAAGRIAIVRVPGYSPHAVAEHTMALLLALNRKVHRAWARTRDFNFSLSGLEGVDLYAKTAGIVGNGTDRPGVCGHLPRIWHEGDLLRSVPDCVGGVPQRLA